ncbi:MAG: translation initiation factor IF-2 [Parasporobacterium sp.]|nr:translation initiation factor IF-2 [Parasporobacterium sp.]
MRIHELAKEIGVENKVIVDFLQNAGVQVRSHMSACPDDMLETVRKKFGKGAAQTETKTAAPAGGGIKAVAVPDFIAKEQPKTVPTRTADGEKIEDGGKQIAKIEAKKAAMEKADAKDEAPKKKKKIIAVFNPQNSNTEKGRAIAKAQRDDHKKASDQTRRPLPSEVRPARDRTPDDEKAPKKILPSQLRPARDRIPDDELAEMKAKEEAKKAAEAKAAEEAAAKAEAEKHAQEEAAKKETEAKTAEPEKKETAVPEAKKPEETAKPAEKPADKPKESEAVKSLREKIVKGTVSVSDIQVSRNPKDKNRGDNRGDRRQGGGKDRGQQGGRGPQGQQNRPGQGQGRGPAPAPQSSDSKGKGKGGKQKGKYDKQRGDKFDRLENERGAQRQQKVAKTEPEEEIKVITLPETISLKDFAAKLKMQPAALIKKLFLQGQVLTVNDILDFETAEAIALDMDILVEKEVEIDYIEELLKEEEEDESKMVKRPPVVCVMGHVDHGKTSLLDAIRKTNVIAKEAGGITQHIGAYMVQLPSGDKLTFLDTPGHEAFTSMRLRGAMATDVAILVVAADDGVMPQTVEAINHAKAAGIHVIVAVNKIDKPGANIDKVKQELSEHDLVPEDWGGNTIFVPVSAKTGEGIQDLLEMVILDTEILELKADPDRMARGLVIEAKLDKGRGSVATLLVQKGTLHVGDHIAMGESYGKVRAMTNDRGEKVKSASPSTPVEITGMNGVPNAGEVFVAYDNDKEAKAFAAVFVEENKKKLLAGTRKKTNLDDLFDQMKAGELKELELIIKADVQGSVEAIKDSLEKLSNDEVVVKVIHSGVGNVNESDAILASASNAIIIAFNVQTDAVARDTIEHEKVDMRTYNVIYNAIDDVENAMKGMLEPIYEEVVTGHVEVRQTFKASGIGIIAGSYVTDGVVQRGCKIRLTRDGEQLFDGNLASLKRFQDDVKEVRSGYECGIVLDGFQDIKEGDLMEAYIMKEVPRN